MSVKTIQHCSATAPVSPVGIHSALKIEKVSGCRHVRAVMSYFTKCEQCIIDKCLEIERRIKKLACSASNGEYLCTIFHTCQSRNKGWNEIKIGTKWRFDLNAFFQEWTCLGRVMWVWESTMPCLSPFSTFQDNLTDTKRPALISVLLAKIHQYHKLSDQVIHDPWGTGSYST